MRAVIIDEPGTMHVGDWSAPECKDDEIVVEVGAAGLCAGDMYFYLGKNPYAKYPQICGHEIAGTVREIGHFVSGFHAGDHVVVEPFIGCGRCYSCKIGKSNCCARLEIIGVHRAGGYAERVVAPANRVHQIPDGMTIAQAVFAEPVAIGVQACRRGGVAKGELAVVLGCGPIGLAVIEVARSRGARVLATDTRESRMEAGASLGAEILPPGTDLEKEIRDRTEGDGAPVVIEATGVPAVMARTLDLVAPGGRVVILGLVASGVPVAMNGLDFTRKEVTILGSRASVDCFPESLRLLAEGEIRYPRIATQFEMWRAPEVFAEMANDPDRYHKAIFVRDVN